MNDIEIKKRTLIVPKPHIPEEAQVSIAPSPAESLSPEWVRDQIMQMGEGSNVARSKGLQLIYDLHNQLEN